MLNGRLKAPKWVWRAQSSVKRLSPTRIRQWWTGFTFDLRYGADTNVVVHVADAEVEGDDAIHATKYRATSVGFVAHLLSRVPIACETFDFVDLGSGKGRVLIEAAGFPFRRVIGVELSQKLHASAQALVASYEKSRKAKSNIELRCHSATQFGPLTSDTVFYMYNPFDETVLRMVLASMRRGLEDNQVKLILVYLNPRWFGAIEESGVFRLVDSGQFGPDDYRVYSN